MLNRPWMGVLFKRMVLCLFFICAPLKFYAQPAPQKPAPGALRTYVIKQGNKFYSFFSRPKLFFFRDTLYFTFRLTESCLYEFRLPDGSLDTTTHHAINKVVGFSRGMNGPASLLGYRHGIHKINSARIGWRRTVENGTLKDSFDLFLYCYLRTKRWPHYIGKVEPGETLSGYIVFTRHTLGYNFYNKPWKYERSVRSSFGMGVALYPYFGGRKPAPHTMEIDLDFSGKKSKVINPKS